MGGGNQTQQPGLIAQHGLSPRGRGKRIPAWLSPLRLWSIPAWAGETRRFKAPAQFLSVYPRVGGGNRPTTVATARRWGLSPRGRGKRIPPLVDSPLPGSIPAWAGETPPFIPPSPFCPVYPRVGGGNSEIVLLPGNPDGLSPRGRGKPAVRNGATKSTRSIPAWAGETSGGAEVGKVVTVYPRVGGGNPLDRRFLRRRQGLSPRGRGKPERPLDA